MQILYIIVNVLVIIADLAVIATVLRRWKD